MLPGQQELNAALEQFHFCFPVLQGLERTRSGLVWTGLHRQERLAKGGDCSGFSIRRFLPGSLLWSFTQLFWTSDLVLTSDLLFALGQVALFILGVFRHLGN